MTIFIENLPADFSGEKVLEFLAKYGTVKEMIMGFPVAGEKVNCAWVKLSSFSQENDALSKLNDVVCQGQKLRVKQADLRDYFWGVNTRSVIYAPEPCY
ncbi:RNA-binding protein [Ancylothrix sp. C2]|uniref:RNA recognition motif domain-containing protein n=1 Tax=Ancylothrix sp. D3o TaxID=2953691 RepID=UPI0021BBB1E8|nr:RNA-binding protein [Ancylothrix sp. D3o]MCT7949299.1 RNA-binding protein [Ancylothrix sp. D3o]